MTAVETGGAIDRHWTRSFGLAMGSLPQSGTLVVPHAALIGWAGVFLLRRENTCIVSAPSELVELLANALGDLSANETFWSKTLRRALGVRACTIIGPAWLGYADVSDLHPVESSAQLLREGDQPALRDLRLEAGEEAWEHSGIQIDRPPVFGLYRDHILVSAGMLHETHDGIQNVGIVTHPQHRNHGYATQVTSSLSLHGVRLGRILQYRTLESNEPSLKVARRLGYRPWGRTLSIRLTD